MKWITILTGWTVVAQLVCLPAIASEDLVGTWEGLIEVDPGKVEVEFRIFVASLDEGEIWFPTQGPARQPLVELDLDENRVSFTTIDGQGIVSSFSGEIAGEKIEGEVAEQDMVRPFTLRRMSGDPSATPAVNPPLTVLAAEGEKLREAFNEDRGKVRLLAILSPTCGVCRMDARMIENYLFDRFDDPRLSVYVVWEPELAEDDEAAAREATFFLTSERATHFWSQERFAGRAYQSALGIESPAWDVFFGFGTESTWGDATPAADFYMHNRRGSLPAEHLFDATVLAEKVDALLAEEWNTTRQASAEE